MAPPSPSILYTAEWDTPVFDLRPDLRSAQAAIKNGVPIWNTAGRLYVQLFGLTSFVDDPTNPLPTNIPATVGLKAEAVDEGNTVFAQLTQASKPDVFVTVPFNSVVRIGPPEVITSSFVFPMGQPPSAIVGFAPPGTTLGAGEGYPIRYWRLKVTFSKLYTLNWSQFPNIPPAEIPAPPPIHLLAAYY
jgi:hypothetical protein